MSVVAFIAALVAASAPAGAEAGVFSAYTAMLKDTACSCACCIREPRRPSEVVGDATMKCGSFPLHDERSSLMGCQSRCTVMRDSIFEDFTVVEMDRFCFYNCAPILGGKSSHFLAAVANQRHSAVFNGGALIDEECVELSREQVAAAKSRDHNGQDPLLFQPEEEDEK
mmetsp:Transcript_4781/g.9806  ORF Transcript_4781/g.9806 Transcript_4781/m.9806 type:complete len:169 (-) Transcript_4781:44-550(-)